MNKRAAAHKVNKVSLTGVQLGCAYLSGISVNRLAIVANAHVAEFSAVSLKVSRIRSLISFACRHAQSFLLRERNEGYQAPCSVQVGRLVCAFAP
jgi:hypothetical protein